MDPDTLRFTERLPLPSLPRLGLNTQLVSELSPCSSEDFVDASVTMVLVHGTEKRLNVFLFRFSGLSFFLSSKTFRHCSDRLWSHDVLLFEPIGMSKHKELFWPASLLEHRSEVCLTMSS